MTRLRFVLRDPALAHPESIEAMPGVVSVMHRAGQLQVVVGTEVASAFDAIESVVGTSEEQQPDGGQVKRGSLLGRGLDLLMGTFQPLLWALVGASLIQTALAVLVQVGWLSESSPAYGVWAAAGQAPFVFLPVLVGISAARKLGANPFVGGAIGAALLDERFTDLGAPGTQVELLGLPLAVVDYSQSVFPALLAAVMLSVLERRLRRLLPSFLHLIVIPAVCLAVLVPTDDGAVRADRDHGERGAVGARRVGSGSSARPSPARSWAGCGRSSSCSESTGDSCRCCSTTCRCRDTR